MDKHAFLIMAHNNFLTLEKLLLFLDDTRNDIYLHIDKKVTNFDFEKIQNSVKKVKKSKVLFANRMKVTWGGYSQIQCEINLLKESVKHGYSYYHLISGTDFSIKSLNYIYDFFNQHNGKEFIHFSTNEFNKNIKSRYQVFHPFQDFCGRDKKNILFYLEKVIVKIQQFLNISRFKNEGIIFCGGSKWFSITDELVKYVISKERLIKKLFKHSVCCDEVFLQTIVYNSPYFDKVYKKGFDNDYQACLRYIDWARGNPYEFKKSDYEELIKTSSDYLFARKISDQNISLIGNLEENIISKNYN